MAIPLLCPSCGKRLRFSDAAAGRRGPCPHCGHPIHVPELPEDDDYEPPHAPTLDEVSSGLRTPEGLGMASMFLGFLSLPILCVPFVGYLSLASSSLGLLLGCAGMFRSWERGGLGTSAGGAGGTDFFGVQAQRFPLLGTVVCLVALAFALLPRVI